MKITLFMLVTALLHAPMLKAAPTGGVVIAGQAELLESTDQLDVLQSTERAVIEFEQFNVGEDETVNFIQPNENSVTLNRVIGGQLSEIYGQINANGHIYLINPNGVMFGGSSLIDVNSLLATTMELDQQQFMQGGQVAMQSLLPEGLVENHGRIEADGDVLLLAPAVANTGAIHSQYGDVVMQSANAIWLQPLGSEIALIVDEGRNALEQVGDAPLQSLENSGEIIAKNIDLKASQSQASETPTITNSGLLRAQGVDMSGGVISLVARHGDVVNTGVIQSFVNEAAAENISDPAAEISIKGNRIANLGEISAASTGGGGAVSIQAESLVVLANESSIEASAQAWGDGGSVVVFTPGCAIFESGAAIVARGVGSNGDGGFVEVSGLESVDVRGNVDVGADNGVGGLFYIDPIDITIAEAGTDNTFTANSMGGVSWDAVAANVSAMISPVAINTALQSGSVEIDANTASGGVGNISIASRINLDGGSVGATLRLNAPGTIRFVEDTSGSTSPLHGAIIDEVLGAPNENVNVELIAGVDIVMEPNTSISVVDETNQIDITLDATNNIVMQDNATINSGLGEIDLIAGGDIELGLLQAVRDPADPNDFVIHLDSEGRIYDANSEALNIQAVNGVVRLEAESGINENSLALETQISSLSIANNSNGAIYIHNSADLEIVEVLSAGDMNIELPEVASLSILDTSTNFDANTIIDLSGGGTLEVNSTGLISQGSLFIDAGSIRDNTGSNDVLLVAPSLNINLSTAEDDAVLNTRTDNLSLDLQGAQRFTVIDDNTLSVNGLDWTNELTLSTSVGDLTIDNVIVAPTTNRHLTLVTEANASTSYPDQGVEVTGNLSITTGDIQTPSGNAISIFADNADLNLQNQTGVLNLATRVNQLSLQTLGADVVVNENESITLGIIDVDGELSVSANDNIDFAISTPLIGGAAEFIAGGDINLFNNLLDLSAVSVSLVAEQLVFTPQVGQAAILADSLVLDLQNVQGDFSLSTDVNSLALNLSGADSFTYSNNQDLIINSWDVQEIDVADVSVRGALTIPTEGLNFNQRLSILAEDAYAGDGQALALSGGDLLIHIDSPTANTNLDLNVNSLDLNFGVRANGGMNTSSVNITDADGLILSDLDNDGLAAQVDDGALSLSVVGGLSVFGGVTLSNSNLFVDVTGGDLVFDADVVVSDDSVDGERRGLINLNVTNGDLTIGESGGVNLQSTNAVEPLLVSSLGQPLHENAESMTAISINLTDTSDTPRSVTIGNVSGDGDPVQLSALGGDIDINAGYEEGQGSDVQRALVQHSNSTIEASNFESSGESGTLIINTQVVSDSPGRIVADSRVINIRDGSVMPIPPEVVITNDYENSTEVIEPEVKVGNIAGRQFDLLFGACDEVTADGRSRCELTLAIKAFLSHWLVGGELPPRASRQ